MADNARDSVELPGTVLRIDPDLLQIPQAQPVIARIAAAVDPDYPDRLNHVKRVATVAVRAKLQPANPFAKATL